MRNTTQPLQTFFQINLRGTEDALPDARQLAAFVDSYNRLYTVLRIATDSNYDADVLLNRGYRLRQRDRLRVRSFRMASPFHAEFILLATSGVVAAVKYLAPIGLEIYKTRRDDAKIRAETAKLEAEAAKLVAEAGKAFAEGRKADAEARKADAETEQILQDLSPARLQERDLVNARDFLPPDPELALDRAKAVTEEISRNLSPERTPDNLQEILMGFLPPQARLPLYRAVAEMTKSSFVIVHVEVVATQIADSDHTQQSER